MGQTIKSFTKASLSPEFVVGVLFLMLLTWHKSVVIPRLGGTITSTHRDSLTFRTPQKGGLVLAYSMPENPAPDLNHEQPSGPAFHSFWSARQPDSLQGKWISRVKGMIEKKSLTGIHVTKGSGSLVMNISAMDVNREKKDLSAGLESKLKGLFPDIVTMLAEDPEFKNKVQKIKILGFGKVNRKGNDQLDYDYALGLEYAKSVYRYLFNVDKLTYRHQDFAVARATTSGNGLKYLAREMTPPDEKEYLKAFCKKWNCNEPDKLMFRVYFKGESL